MITHSLRQLRHRVFTTLSSLRFYRRSRYVRSKSATAKPVFYGSGILAVGLLGNALFFLLLFLYPFAALIYFLASLVTDVIVYLVIVHE